jgi:hypothetical protein
MCKWFLFLILVGCFYEWLFFSEPNEALHPVKIPEKKLKRKVPVTVEFYFSSGKDE